MSIVFRSEKISFKLKRKSTLEKWIGAVIEKEKKLVGEIHFVFCSDKFLVALNKKYLKHNTLTDIITFDYSQKEKLIGEVYISIARVKENAKKYDARFEEELHRVMIHGVLHLCGYKDKTESEKEKIRKKEDDSLKFISQ